MLTRFRVNLGRLDAEAIAKKTGISVDWSKCRIGTEHDLPDEVVNLLNNGSRQIVEILEEKKVRGVAKQSEITAPQK